MSITKQPSVISLLARLKRGEISALEVANAYISQVDAHEPQIQAFAWFDAEYVREQAKQLDSYRLRGLPMGPLHGIPVALKDIIDTKAIPTENGTALDSGRVPKKDAAIVEMLRSAGAIIFAKTRTTELAFLTPCETQNPYDATRTPGGSSSGSAAAVAAGMVPIAIGTQTGGSVIRPASFCGVHALKPTFGLISRRGVLLQSPTLDTLGVFAHDLGDLALVLDVLAGYDEQDSATQMTPSPQALKTCQETAPVTPNFALVEPPGYEKASEEMRAALEELGEVLGEQVFSTTLPKAFDEGIHARETINFAEMAKCYYPYTKRGRDSLSPTLLGAIEKGEEARARDYIAALDWRNILNAGLDELFERCDALIVPSATGEAPAKDSTGDPILNGIWTLCGTPVINLPVFTSSNGLPMGISLVGPAGGDARLLRTARWLEEYLTEQQASEEVA